MEPANLHLAVVDKEFRDILIHNGVPADSLPVPIDEPDLESLDFWTEGAAAMEIYACGTLQTE